MGVDSYWIYMTSNSEHLPEKAQKVRVGILASGSGSTAERLATDAFTHDLLYEPVVVVSNNPNAAVFNKLSDVAAAHEKRIAGFCINKFTHPERLGQPSHVQTKAESHAIRQSL